jgi:hypothetical protein
VWIKLYESKCMVKQWKIGQVLYIFYLHPSLRILGPNQKYSWYNHFMWKYWKQHDVLKHTAVVTFHTGNSYCRYKHTYKMSLLGQVRNGGEGGVCDGEILSRCQQTHKWNFIHSCKECMAFTLLTSQNSLMFISIIFRSLILKFTWSGQWTWKVERYINLHSQVKCSFRGADFHICICSTLFCKYLLYLLSCEPNTRFNHWC